MERYFNLSTTDKFTSKNQYGKAFQGNIVLIATFVGEIILSEVLRTSSSTNFAKKASVEIVVTKYNIILRQKRIQEWKHDIFVRII